MFPNPAHVRVRRRLATVSGLAMFAFASPVWGQDARQGEDDLLPHDTLVAGQVDVPLPPPGADLPPVEPVITDAEFNAAIPAFVSAGDPAGDPAIEGPLETIEAFEQRLAGEEARDAAETPAAPEQASQPGGPALEDGAPFETVGDAAVRDAELLVPLPPLASFDVEPAGTVAVGGDREAAEVPYKVVVSGLREADRAVGANLRDRFDDLSALEDGNGKAANAAMVAARLAEDSELMKRILAAEGWHGAEVVTRIEQPAGPGAALQAIIAVTPGKRYMLSQIMVQAGQTEPPGLVRDSLPLRAGEPVAAERILAAEARVALALPENGYPFAAVGERDILLDPALGTGVYTLPVDTGPRARFGGFEAAGKAAFGERHVAVLARFDKGDLYDSRKVDDLRRALVATGLFSAVGVEPKRTGQSAGEGTEYVTMLVTQEAGPPRTLAGTAGYSTGEGFRVEGSWIHRNLFPPEGSLSVRGVLGTLEQGAALRLRRANAGQRDRTIEALAEVLHSRFDAYSAYTGRLAVSVARESTPIWQKRMTYNLGVQLLATAETDFDITLGEHRRTTYYIGGLSALLGLDVTDSLLDPTRGFRLSMQAEPEAALADGFTPYVRARIDGSAYFPASENLVMAARVRVGTIQGAGQHRIAPSRRLYAGGGGSVRGFGFQHLGPLDPLGDPLGGRSLNEASAEVRYRFGDYGIVGFVDVGQAYASSLPRLSDLRVGAGIGGRFYTNFGPMRVDVATPVDHRKGEGRFNVYVSIGQAF